MRLKCKLLGLFTHFQAEVLKELRDLGAQQTGQYWKPKELGAYRGSHHARTLAALVSRGHVERTDLGRSEAARPTFAYRISAAGAQALREFEEIATTPAAAVPGRTADRARLLQAQGIVGSRLV